MRDMGNRNMVKSTTKCQGIHGARKGHPVYTTESQKITDKWTKTENQWPWKVI